MYDAGVNIIEAENHYDNTSGSVVFAVLGQKQGFTGATGTGILARITFRGKAVGYSPIKFEKSSGDQFVLYRYSDNEQGFEDYPSFEYDGTIVVE